MSLKVKFVEPVGFREMVLLKDNGKIIIRKVLKEYPGYKETPKMSSMDNLRKKYPTITGLAMETLWNTPSGKLEPGCMYWNTWLPENFYWENHKGPHLEVILPNGNLWNIDSRASNCTMKDDKTHRCWCRHGSPPSITVDKNGHTCRAGAGSIASGNYHGFLRNGELT